SALFTAVNKYLFCLFATLSVANRETHFNTLLQATAAAIADSAEMYEYLAAILGKNKAKAFVRVAPFYFALFLVFRANFFFLSVFSSRLLWFIVLFSSSAFSKLCPWQQR